jgi:hypothetical protein
MNAEVFGEKCTGLCKLLWTTSKNKTDLWLKIDK